MDLLRTLRKKLTLSFLGVSLLIYLLSVALAGIFFSAGLKADLYDNLSRLIGEIQPAVHIQNGSPTLREWAESARVQHHKIVHIVQLYNKDGVLLEEYGRPGEHKLCNGQVDGWGLKRLHHFASKCVPISDVGYLQLQEDEKQTFDALNRFYASMLLIVPLLALGAGGGGYFLAGYAVQPVARSMRILRQFVADAGHELNTPTTIIEASVQTLEEVLGDNNSLSVVQAIGRASQRLRNLSANLVFLAKMESAELPLKLERLNVDTLVAQVTEEFEEIAQGKGVELIYKVNSNSSVSGNSDSLYRLLANLISNAVRYTEAGGMITVTAQKGDDLAVLIRVRDTGIGIPSDSLGRIFDRFYRVDNSRSREAGGTGLGLSIVKAIIEAHKGTVKVESTLGKGSLFSVSLPSASDTVGVNSPSKNCARSV